MKREPRAGKHILFISNGHGEDHHAFHILQALAQLRPDIEAEAAALPIVGQGEAYRRLNVPLIGPTQTLPSGGFSYMNRLHLLRDIQAGLIGLTWRQFQALRRHAPRCDLLVAIGDTVAQAFAYLASRPFVAFISPLSSYYEGQLHLGPILWHCLSSPRCLTLLTKDPYTARDLNRQGLSKAKFGGLPALDHLIPEGKDLHLHPRVPTIALLPGSRLPEAAHNFRLQLQLVLEIARVMPAGGLQFRAALVPTLQQQLPEIAAQEGWQLQGNELACKPAGGEGEVAVRCYADAFSDILHRANLVVGMAGSAVEQAVALGKPAIQIPGPGPQFTYRFAEAQMRLLGSSVQTIGTGPATPETLKQAARRVVETLADSDYLADCQQNGRHRFGPPGASERMANLLIGYLEGAASATEGEGGNL